MLNNMIDAISLKLKQEFGSEIAVYREPVEQGESTPCFFVYLQTSNQKKLLGKRYFLEQKFIIHYHPGTANKNGEILDTIERLGSALEYITIEGDLFRGTNMSYEVADSILHFFVNYNFYVYRELETIDVMESMAVETGVKKG
ncbi:MAG: phage tail terminator family protein [Ruminiclostridium sp.]